MGTDKEQKLGNRLKTRFTPIIQFVLDLGVKKSIEVARLINEALAQSRPAVTEPDADGTAAEYEEHESRKERSSDP